MDTGRHFYAQSKAVAQIREANLKPKKLCELSPEEIDKRIYEYAQTVPFRTYYLSTSETEIKFDTKNSFTYYGLGCQGNGGENQHMVGKGLDHELAMDPNPNPLVFITGDNYYDSGAHTPSALKKFFDDVYLVSTNSNCKRAKFIAIGGNHDANIHKLNILQDTGNKVLLNQVAYTYRLKLMECDQNKTFEEAIKEVDAFFNRKAKHPDENIKEEVYFLPIAKLPAWNMFSTAFSVVAGNTEFYCLNSNTLAEDIVDYLKNPETVQNQAEFFIKAVQADRALKNLMIHHPVSTVGGRAYGNDFELYCPDVKKRNEIYTFLGLDPKAKHSNNEVVDVALQKLKEMKHFHVNGIYTAHDHNMYYALSHLQNKKNNYYDAMFCLGGGGGKLQCRKYFGTQAQMGGFFENFGFGKFVYDQIKNTVSSFLNILKFGNKKTIIKHVYQYPHRSINPVRNYPTQIQAEERLQVEKLCEVTKRALDRYFAFIHKRQEGEEDEKESKEEKEEPIKQNEKVKGKFLSKIPKYGNLSHGNDGITRANELWNYISKTEADDFITTLENIKKISDWNFT